MTENRGRLHVMKQCGMPTRWTTCPNADSLSEIICLIVYRTLSQGWCHRSLAERLKSRSTSQNAGNCPGVNPSHPCNKPQSLRVQFRKQVQAISGISEPADDESSIHWEGDVQESSISLNLQNSGSFRLKSFQPCAQILNARNE